MLSGNLACLPAVAGGRSPRRAVKLTETCQYESCSLLSVCLEGPVDAVSPESHGVSRELPAIVSKEGYLASKRSLL